MISTVVTPMLLCITSIYDIIISRRVSVGLSNFCVTSMKRIWRIDEAYKGVTIQENELAIGVGHRKYPGYDKKNFVTEIRQLGVRAHSAICYTPNPLKAERDYCIITDNYFKLRFLWLFALLFLLRYKLVAVLLEPVAVKGWSYAFVSRFNFLWSLIITHDQETYLHSSQNYLSPNISANSNAVEIKNDWKEAAMRLSLQSTKRVDCWASRSEKFC